MNCATGNGLEHIKPKITKHIYAIDINPDYLNKTRRKFKDKISNLVILNTDIQNDEIKIENIDLVFIGLVLEYVDTETVLRKIIKTLNEKGALLIVIQKNKQTSFVSKTKSFCSAISKILERFSLTPRMCSNVSGIWGRYLFVALF